MADHLTMWRILRSSLAQLEREALMRLVNGTKEEFDRNKGIVEAIQEIQGACDNIEKQSLFGTLKEPANGGSNGPTTTDD